MARRASSLAIALLCVLAGCSGFVGGDSTADVEETVTPAPVPTVEPEYAAGISPDAVNGHAVARTHVRELTDRSYTSRTQVRWRTGNGTTYNESVTHWIGQDESRIRVHADFAYPRRNDNRTGYELWYDGESSVVLREFADGGSELTQFDSPPAVNYPREELVRSVFSRLDPDQVSQSSDGGTVVSGRISDVTGPLDMPPFDREGNATMTARIAPAGHVDKVAVGFDAVYEGRPVRVRLTMEYWNVGATTVSEPEWVTDRRDANASRETSTSTPVE